MLNRQKTMNDSATPPADETLVMLSALQHYLFCRRQCALIHLEQSWAENRLTASGRILHERVDERKSETRRTLRQATAAHQTDRRMAPPTHSPVMKPPDRLLLPETRIPESSVLQDWTPQLPDRQTAPRKKPPWSPK